MHLFHVSLALNETKGAELLARVFEDKFDQRNCSEKLCAQDLSKFPNPGPGDMHILRWKGARRKEQSGWHRFLRTNSINAIVWEIDGFDTLGDGTRIASGLVHELASTMFFRHAKEEACCVRSCFWVLLPTLFVV